MEALKAKIAKLEGENKRLKEDNDRYLYVCEGGGGG